MEQTWLVFIPQLPSSPSSLRVLVWRRMRAAGAAALAAGGLGVAAAPEHEQFLRDVLLRGAAAGRQRDTHGRDAARCGQSVRGR